MRARELPVVVMTTSNLKQRMFLSLVKISGRDPADYSVSEIDSRIYVHGPCAGAVYSGFHWMSQFTRDLYSGFFERPSAPLSTEGSDRQRVLH